MRTMLIQRAARSWPVRGGLAVADQAVFAGSNFVLNVYLARSLPPAQFGAFTLTLAVFLALFGLYNAIQLEPVSVLGPARYDDRRRGYVSAQLKIHLCVTGVLGTLLIVTGLAVARSTAPTGVSRSFVAAGLACPPVLLCYLTRRLLYARNLQVQALAGSLLYACTLCGLILLAAFYGGLSPAGAFGMLALASGTGSVFMLWRLHSGHGCAVERTCDMRSLLGEQREYGKYLVGTVVLQSAAVHGLTFMTTAMLGLSAVGILRAMQTFVLPFGHTMIALFAVAQPALARDFSGGRFDAIRRKSAGVAAVVLGLAVACELGFLAFHHQLESVLFGGKFAAYSGLIPVFGAAIIFEGLAGTQGLVLRALQRPRLQMLSIAATVPIALTIGFLLIRSAGLWGAAAATGATWAVLAVATHLMSRRYVGWETTPLRFSARRIDSSSV